ncbi:hypothetical protein LSCM1_07986 [Leishmania martiniquensis]|uniref:Uncharacterized protein n=1 Tax=Leishmania martiniquensis TaxID=1580590 RepID=A0A836GRD2_9TRYP|nr:hypothetical protein LSCM1_07986 [Leishmania martiniquensis]
MWGQLRGASSSTKRCDGVTAGASLVDAHSNDLDSRSGFSKSTTARTSADGGSCAISGMGCCTTSGGAANTGRALDVKRDSGSGAPNVALSSGTPSAQTAPDKKLRGCVSGSVAGSSSLACEPSLAVDITPSYTIGGTRSVTPMTLQDNGDVIDTKHSGDWSPSSRAGRTSRMYRGSIGAAVALRRLSVTSCSDSGQYLGSGSHIDCFPVATVLSRNSTHLVAAADIDAVKADGAQRQLGGTADIMPMSWPSSVPRRGSPEPHSTDTKDAAATCLIPTAPVDAGAGASLLLSHELADRPPADSHSPAYLGSNTAQQSSNFAEGQPAHLIASGMSHKDGGGGRLAQPLSVSRVGLSPTSSARGTSVVLGTNAGSPPGTARRSLIAGPFVLIQLTARSSLPSFAGVATVVNVTSSAASSTTESALVAHAFATDIELTSGEGAGAAAAPPLGSTPVERLPMLSAVATPHATLLQRLAPLASHLPAAERSVAAAISGRTATNASKAALTTGPTVTVASAAERRPSTSLFPMPPAAAALGGTITAVNRLTGGTVSDGTPSASEASTVASAVTACAAGRQTPPSTPHPCRARRQLCRCQRGSGKVDDSMTSALPASTLSSRQLPVETVSGAPQGAYQSSLTRSLQHGRHVDEVSRQTGDLVVMPTLTDRAASTHLSAAPLPASAPSPQRVPRHQRDVGSERREGAAAPRAVVAEERASGIARPHLQRATSAARPSASDSGGAQYHAPATLRACDIGDVDEGDDVLSGVREGVAYGAGSTPLGLHPTSTPDPSSDSGTKDDAAASLRRHSCSHHRVRIDCASFPQITPQWPRLATPSEVSASPGGAARRGLLTLLPELLFVPPADPSGGSEGQVTAAARAGRRPSENTGTGVVSSTWTTSLDEFSGAGGPKRLSDRLSARFPGELNASLPSPHFREAKRAQLLHNGTAALSRLYPSSADASATPVRASSPVDAGAMCWAMGAAAATLTPSGGSSAWSPAASRLPTAPHTDAGRPRMGSWDSAIGSRSPAPSCGPLFPKEGAEELLCSPSRSLAPVSSGRALAPLLTLADTTVPSPPPPASLGDDATATPASARRRLTLDASAPLLRSPSPSSTTPGGWQSLLRTGTSHRRASGAALRNVPSLSPPTRAESPVVGAKASPTLLSSAFTIASVPGPKTFQGRVPLPSAPPPSPLKHAALPSLGSAGALSGVAPHGAALTVAGPPSLHSVADGPLGDDGTSMLACCCASSSRHTCDAATAPKPLHHASTSTAAATELPAETNAKSDDVSPGAAAKTVEAHNQITLAGKVAVDENAAQPSARSGRGARSSSSGRGSSASGGSDTGNRMPSTARSSSGPATPAYVAATGSTTYLSVVSVTEFPAYRPAEQFFAGESGAPHCYPQKHSSQPQLVDRRTSPHTAQSDSGDDTGRLQLTCLAATAASANSDAPHLSAAACSSTSSALATASQRSVIGGGAAASQGSRMSKVSALSAVARLVARLRRLTSGGKPSVIASSAGASLGTNDSDTNGPETDAELQRRGTAQEAPLAASSPAGATFCSDASKAVPSAAHSISADSPLPARCGTRVRLSTRSSLASRHCFSGPRAEPSMATPAPNVATVARPAASPLRPSFPSSTPLSPPSTVLLQMPVSAGDEHAICGGGGTGVKADLLGTALDGPLTARDTARPLAGPSLPVGWQLQEQRTACTFGSSGPRSEIVVWPKVDSAATAEKKALTADRNSTSVENARAVIETLTTTAEAAPPLSGAPKGRQARSPSRLSITSSPSSDAEVGEQALRSTCKGVLVPSVVPLSTSSSVTEAHPRTSSCGSQRRPCGYAVLIAAFVAAARRPLRCPRQLEGSDTSLQAGRPSRTPPANSTDGMPHATGVSMRHDSLWTLPPASYTATAGAGAAGRCCSAAPAPVPKNVRSADDNDAGATHGSSSGPHPLRSAKASIISSSAAAASSTQSQPHARSNRGAPASRTTWRGIGDEMGRQLSAVLPQRRKPCNSGVAISSEEDRTNAEVSTESQTLARNAKTGGDALCTPNTCEATKARAAEPLYAGQGRQAHRIAQSGAGVVVERDAASSALLPGIAGDEGPSSGSGAPRGSAMRTALMPPLFHLVLNGDADDNDDDGGGGPYASQVTASPLKTPARTGRHLCSSAGAASNDTGSLRYDRPSRSTSAAGSSASPPYRQLCSRSHTTGPLLSLPSAAQMISTCSTLPPALSSATSAMSASGCGSPATGSAPHSTSPRMVHASPCFGSSAAVLQRAPSSVTTQDTVRQQGLFQVAPLSRRTFVSALDDTTARPFAAAGDKETISFAPPTLGAPSRSTWTRTALMHRPRSGPPRQWTSTLRPMDSAATSISTTTTTSSLLSLCPPRRPRSSTAAAPTAFSSISQTPECPSTLANAARSAPWPVPSQKRLEIGGTRCTPRGYRGDSLCGDAEHQRLDTGNRDRQPRDSHHTAAATLLLGSAAARRRLSDQYGSSATAAAAMGTTVGTAVMPESRSGSSTVLVSDAAHASAERVPLELCTLRFTPAVPTITAKALHMGGGGRRRFSSGRSPPHPLAAGRRSPAPATECELAVAAHDKLLVLEVCDTATTPTPPFVSVPSTRSTIGAPTPCSGRLTELRGGGDFGRGATGDPTTVDDSQVACGALREGSAALFSVPCSRADKSVSRSLGWDHGPPHGSGSFGVAKSGVPVVITPRVVQLTVSAAPASMHSTTLEHRNSGSSGCIVDDAEGAARQASVTTATGSSSGAADSGGGEEEDAATNRNSSTPLPTTMATCGANHSPPLLSCDAAPALFQLCSPLLFHHQRTESFPSGGVPELMLDKREPNSPLKPTPQPQSETGVQWPAGLCGAAARDSPPQQHQQQQQESGMSVSVAPEAPARLSGSPSRASATSVIPSPPAATAPRYSAQAAPPTAAPSGAFTVLRGSSGGAAVAAVGSSNMTNYNGPDAPSSASSAGVPLAGAGRPPAIVPLSCCSLSCSTRPSHSLLFSGAEYDLPAPLSPCDASGSGAGGSAKGGHSVRTSSELPSGTLASLLYFPPELRRGPQWRHLQQHLRCPRNTASPPPPAITPQHSGRVGTPCCSTQHPQMIPTSSSSSAVLAIASGVGAGTTSPTRPSSPRLSGERRISPTAAAGRRGTHDGAVTDSAEERRFSHSLQGSRRYKALSCQMMGMRPFSDDAGELSLVSAVNNATLATFMSEWPSGNNASISAVTRWSSSTHASDEAPAAAAEMAAGVPPRADSNTGSRLRKQAESPHCRDNGNGAHSGPPSSNGAGAAVDSLSYSGRWPDTEHGSGGDQTNRDAATATTCARGSASPLTCWRRPYDRRSAELSDQAGNGSRVRPAPALVVPSSTSTYEGVHDAGSSQRDDSDANKGSGCGAATHPASYGTLSPLLLSTELAAPTPRKARRRFLPVIAFHSGSTEGPEWSQEATSWEVDRCGRRDNASVSARRSLANGAAIRPGDQVGGGDNPSPAPPLMDPELGRPVR